MPKPKILICNDDGISAPGIRHLYEAVKDYGDCTVVAPAEQQSGKGLSITLHAPLRLQNIPWGGADAHYVTGTPADAVKLALNKLFVDSMPDIIISGINKGTNAGRNALYSGTIGCVIEGVLRGIPGIAFSCTGHDHVGMEDPCYEGKGSYVRDLVEYVLEHPLNPGCLLNVNFPNEPKGLRWARQGLEYWIDAMEERQDPTGNPYCWLGGELSKFDEHEDSDVALLKQGWGTVVPLQISELTDHKQFTSRKSHFEERFSVRNQPLNLSE